METKILIIISFTLIGLLSALFGILVVFSKRFLDLLLRTIWKPKEPSLFSEKDGYLFDKYIRGISAIAIGFLFLAFALWIFLS